MNKKGIAWLSVLAVSSAVVCLVVPGSGSNILLVMALPFQLLGEGLRALSLSSPAGNIAAIFIYVGICLMPLGWVLKKKRDKEDWLLALMSGMLFYVVYLMINPGLMAIGMDSDVGSVILSGTIYSIFLTWAVLKLLRRGASMDMVNGYRVLRVLLAVCAALSILAGFGSGAGELKAEILAVGQANTTPGQNLVDTYCLLFFIFAVQALEYTLDAWLMLHGISLTRELEQNPYTESCVSAARMFSKRAQRYLTIIMLSNMLLNVFQVLAASRLYNIDATVRIPVFSVAFCLGCMALTRLLGQGREIKEENDLYI